MLVSLRRLPPRLHHRVRGLKTGIIGLPNVGKSSLFNALTSNAVKAENFPFCTIEPNVGIVPVPDPRLSQLRALYDSERELPTSLEFVDIAGLVEGASKGEGLGNKFLANIRECDALVHVVRCFEDDDVLHVSSNVDPSSDVVVIRLELLFSDLEQVQKRIARMEKGKAKAASAVTPAQWEAEVSGLAKVLPALEEGACARTVALSAEERAALKPLGLLSLKPVLLAGNVDEEDLAACSAAAPETAFAGATPQFAALAAAAAAQRLCAPIAVSSRFEAELAQLPDEERAMFMEDLGLLPEGGGSGDLVADDGLPQTGLGPLVRATRDMLGLISFYTAGPMESRAWTVEQGSLAPHAAGQIHSDFERGFIAAETVACKDLLEHGGEKGAKEAGLVRSEGKDYVVQDGDVMLFRFNV